MSEFFHAPYESNLAAVDQAMISAIRLTTQGEKITPGKHVTLIVGPNNSGKSALLSRLFQEISHDPQAPSPVVTPPVSSVELALPSPDRVRELLRARATLHAAGTYPTHTLYESSWILSNNQQVADRRVEELVSARRLGPLASAMVLMMGPEGRGGSLVSQPVPDLMAVPGAPLPMHMAGGPSPLQALWTNRELEELLDGYMLRAFGRRILVNRHAGAQVHLHIGEVAAPEPRLGESSEYQEQVLELPLLSAQGAGVQAFMGTILSIVSGAIDILVLDEPEVFLHPPQAKLLGEIVAEISRDRQIQVVVATHSDDFVQGVLTTASKHDDDVSIVRLTRPRDTENRAAHVRSSAIQTIYRDPLLRFSRILDGIFYRGVALCEAESDCTYYAAALAHVEEAAQLGSSDILFTQVGGKDRLARAYRALAAAAVPTVVVADIDGSSQSRV